jgi:rRNA maturation protein Rpf1
MSQDGVAEKALELDADRVIVVDRWHGGPGRINLFQVTSNGLTPVPPVVRMSGIRLRREIKEKTRGACSSVITVDSTNSSELQRTAESLSQFLGLPLLPLDEATKGHRVSMHFSLDSKKRLQITFMVLGRMVEIGPRLTLSRLIWEVSS